MKGCTITGIYRATRRRFDTQTPAAESKQTLRKLRASRKTFLLLYHIWSSVYYKLLNCHIRWLTVVVTSTPVKDAKAYQMILFLRSCVSGCVRAGPGYSEWRSASVLLQSLHIELIRGLLILPVSPKLAFAGLFHTQPSSSSLITHVGFLPQQ